MAEGSRELQMWLGANVSESYRAAVLAVADCLEDLRSSDLDELEAVLALNSWPVLTRRRFVDAWRELKGEGAAAAPMAPEPVAEPMAEPEPPAPAPRDEETLEPRDGEAGALYKRPCRRRRQRLAQNRGSARKGTPRPRAPSRRHRPRGSRPSHRRGTVPFATIDSRRTRRSSSAPTRCARRARRPTPGSRRSDR